MVAKYVLDTSFILAFLFEKDYYHEQAEQIYKRLPDNAVLITHQLVIPEASTVVCRRCREKKIDCTRALEVLKKFLDSIEISLRTYSYKQVIEEMKRLDCELSFVDTVLLKEALRMNAELLTFDYNLKRTFEKVKSK